jgi:hypothetical protein
MMNNTAAKPRLTFFQAKYDERLPAFLRIHKQEHIKCLAEWFEVTVINEDCDYLEICDQHQPDLTLFESGVSFPSCRRLKISNSNSNSRIPKLGFLHTDAFCWSRAGSLSDMDHWGINTFFSIATTASEHTPSIAKNLFVWPNFADTEVYRDYGLWKSIPVLFTGNNSGLYPWRQQMIKLVSKRYPSLIWPHPGYTPSKSLVQVTAGEQYARYLNASTLVPACGTVVKEVVRKHFEVPACNACLVTEKSPALEAAGFVDMKNCVFADEHDILDKCTYLFQNIEELRAISKAGHELVHSRHTLKHRNQIWQWFMLNRNLASGQRIVQPSPFEPLATVPNSSAVRNWHPVSNGAHLALIHEGDAKMRKGKYDEGEERYTKCLTYIPWMPEAQLRLALCKLYKGDAKAAQAWLMKPLQRTLAEYGAADVDPVEWAHFLVMLLCKGEIREAARRADQFPWLRHPELDHARWSVSVLSEGPDAPRPLPAPSSQCRASLHQLPARSLREWTEQLCIMLRACGQARAAGIVSVAAFAEPSQSGERTDMNQVVQKKRLAKKKRSDRPPSTDMFERSLTYSRKTVAAREFLGDILHRLETKYGYFLPYRFSRSRHDEFFQVIREGTSEESVASILVIGAVEGQPGTEAALAGSQDNKRKPLTVCITYSVGGAAPIATCGKTLGKARWYRIKSSAGEEFQYCLEDTINRAKEETGIDRFDVVAMFGSALQRQDVGDQVLREASSANRVLLENISMPGGHLIYSQLLENNEFALLDQNSNLRNGYAVFGRVPSAVSSENVEPCLVTSLQLE